MVYDCDFINHCFHVHIVSHKACSSVFTSLKLFHIHSSYSLVQFVNELFVNQQIYLTLFPDRGHIRHDGFD